jgi:hypothetical protein
MGQALCAPNVRKPPDDDPPYLAIGDLVRLGDRAYRRTSLVCLHVKGRRMGQLAGVTAAEVGPPQWAADLTVELRCREKMAVIPV